MRIAVTYDNGQVWQHFGKTEYFKIYDAEDGAIVSEEVIGTEGQGCGRPVDDPREARSTDRAGRRDHGALADFLLKHHVDAVICGGVGSPMINRLSGYGIKAYPGVTGDTDQAVAALLTGNLSVNEEAVHSGCHHHG